MDHLDYSYLLQVGSRLDLFSEIRRGQYRARCPFCGDSKKSKTLSRLYFFEAEEKVRAYCHNCGYSSTLAYFIKNIDPRLFEEYKLHKFKESVSGSRTQKTEEKPMKTRVSDRFKSRKSKMSHCHPVEKSQKCISYLNGRKIPEKYWSDLFYLENVFEFVREIPKYADVSPLNTPSLVIPYYLPDRIITIVTIRSLQSKFYAKYEINDGPRIWGLQYLDKENRSYCFEAPIDAMMVDNGTSMGGIHLSKDAEDLLVSMTKEVVYVFDNDYSTNRQVKIELERRIQQGYSVVIYDKEFLWKDSNDAVVKGGWSRCTLKDYLDSRTFKGSRAKLELARQIKF